MAGTPAQNWANREAEPQTSARKPSPPAPTPPAAESPGGGPQQSLPEGAAGSSGRVTGGD